MACPRVPSLVCTSCCILLCDTCGTHHTEECSRAKRGDDLSRSTAKLSNCDICLNINASIWCTECRSKMCCVCLSRHKLVGDICETHDWIFFRCKASVLHFPPEVGIFNDKEHLKTSSSKPISTQRRCDKQADTSCSMCGLLYCEQCSKKRHSKGSFRRHIVKHMTPPFGLVPTAYGPRPICRTEIPADTKSLTTTMNNISSRTDNNTTTQSSASTLHMPAEQPPPPPLYPSPVVRARVQPASPLLFLNSPFQRDTVSSSSASSYSWDRPDSTTPPTTARAACKTFTPPPPYRSKSNVSPLSDPYPPQRQSPPSHHPTQQQQQQQPYHQQQYWFPTPPSPKQRAVPLSQCRSAESFPRHLEGHQQQPRYQQPHGMYGPHPPPPPQHHLPRSEGFPSSMTSTGGNNTSGAIRSTEDFNGGGIPPRVRMPSPRTTARSFQRLVTASSGAIPPAMPRHPPHPLPPHHVHHQQQQPPLPPPQQPPLPPPERQPKQKSHQMQGRKQQHEGGGQNDGGSTNDSGDSACGGSSTSRGDKSFGVGGGGGKTHDVAVVTENPVPGSVAIEADSMRKDTGTPKTAIVDDESSTEGAEREGEEGGGVNEENAGGVKKEGEGEEEACVAVADEGVDEDVTKEDDADAPDEDDESIRRMKEQPMDDGGGGASSLLGSGPGRGTTTVAGDGGVFSYFSSSPFSSPSSSSSSP